MFGFSFGFAFFMVISALLKIAGKVGLGPDISGAVSDGWAIVATFVLSVMVGATAQLGLVGVVKKYSKQ